jgi:hypothetical protein
MVMDSRLRGNDISVRGMMPVPGNGMIPTLVFFEVADK